MAAYQLLSAATATNSAPTAATDGVAIPYAKDDGVIVVYDTAGSGTLSVKIKVWGYVEYLDKWFPLGTDATDANRGLLNEGNAIGEVVSDSIEHAEILQGAQHFDRLYAEITAIPATGGTALAVDAYYVNRVRGNH